MFHGKYTNIFSYWFVE